MIDIDTNGYIMYCPCMGQFGNHADLFLGSLAFAKRFNRTLVLPPWERSEPFDKYFELSALEQYHRVVTMEAFMRDIAPIAWPPENRIDFCYMTSLKPGSKNCNSKPGWFWEKVNVEFVASVIYGRQFEKPPSESQVAAWKEDYPPSKYKVLAFTRAPAEFPVAAEHRSLQRFLKWSPDIESAADRFIEETVMGARFVAVHMRNGTDWRAACSLITNGEAKRQLYASPQCLGHANEYGKLTFDLCMPPYEKIVEQLEKAVQKYKATVVLVASVRDHHMLDEFNQALRKVNAKAYAMPPSPHVSLAIMGKADYFIGNCVSTFTAFAKRERDVKGLPSGFWCFDGEAIDQKNHMHDTVEL